MEQTELKSSKSTRAEHENQKSFKFDDYRSRNYDMIKTKIATSKNKLSIDRLMMKS